MSTRGNILCLASLALLCAAQAASARAQVNVRPVELEGVAVVENLDRQLPLDAMLRMSTEIARKHSTQVVH
mgnify:CR=1 FL=1